MTIYIENNKILGIYSDADLRSQIRNYSKMIDAEKNRQQHILSDDFS